MNKTSKTNNFLSSFHNVRKDFNIIQKFLTFVIISSIICVILETEDSISLRYSNQFILLNYFFAIFFLIEYLLRLSTIYTIKKYSTKYGRIKFFFSFHSISDLMAFLPFFIFSSFPELFLLRLFRLFRIMKVAKFLSETKFIKDVFEVLSEKKREIFFSIAITIFVIFLSSICLYLVEGSIQPESFGSIPRSFWWATITLTTVGYGDVYPITILGKLFTIIITIFGIGTVAIPAGIIAGAFSKK